jgi:4-hydroxybutyrate dehydrogenase / sulfolactaldehyde 3-reductase
VSTFDAGINILSKIGFVGLGAMGAPLARNLARHGHKLAVFDVRPNAWDVFRDLHVRVATSPADAAEGVDFLMTVLPTSNDVDEVVLGRGGAVETLHPGAILIDSTTASPTQSMALAATLADREIGMVDATLGRPPWDAEAGTMLFLLGGSDEHLAVVRPILEAMGKDFVYCGPQGSAAKVKAINNYMSVLGMVVAAEALAFGAQAGIDRDVLLKVLQSTVAGRGAINVLYPMKVLAGDVTPLFSMRLAHKDLGVALNFGATLGMPLATGAAGREVLGFGQVVGRFDQDVTALLLALEELFLARRDAEPKATVDWNGE